MPFDGSGNYTPPTAPTFPAVLGSTISSTYYNAVINDLATALSSCLTRDGQGKPTVDITWNNKKLYNVAKMGINGALAAPTSYFEVSGDSGAVGSLGARLIASLAISTAGPSLDWYNSAGGAAVQIASVQAATGATGTKYGELWFSTNNGTALTKSLVLDSSGSLQIIRKAKFGYYTGSGAAVTQTVSRTTAVTINAPTGQITLFNSTSNTAFVAATPFTVNNSYVEAGDVIHCTAQNAASGKVYYPFAHSVQAGSFKLTVLSDSGVTAESPIINFVVLKASAA